MPVARNPMGILPPSLKGTVHQWVNGAMGSNTNGPQI